MKKIGMPLLLTAVIAVSCVGVSVAVVAYAWNGFGDALADESQLPECPAAVNEREVVSRVYTVEPPQGRHHTPEFSGGVAVGDRRLTWYRGLSFSSSDGSPSAAYDSRVITADGKGYRPVPVKWTRDLAVAPDREHAVVLKGKGGDDTDDVVTATDRMGVLDLETGELDWRTLPERATDVVWSPVDDTVLVSTERSGEVLSVDIGSEAVETIELPEPHRDRPAGAVAWTPDGEGFIVTDGGEWEDSRDGTSTVVRLDGGTEPFPVVLDAAELGLSPSGEYADLETDSQLDPLIVDVESGEPVLGEGFDACDNQGHVYELQPKAWAADDRLIALEVEREWDLDQRSVEPRAEPRGDRLVVTDLNGKVVEALTQWGVPLPERLEFATDPT